MATEAVLRRLLTSTSLPAGLVDDVLADTNALWLLGERDDVVAGEIVLCHPPLEDGEVRAVVKGTDDADAWRITVVTADRPGLLAATAGVLADEGLTVTGAALTVLAPSRLAVQRVTARAAGRDRGEDAWGRLGVRLRQTLGGGESPRLSWTPEGPVSVSVHPQGSGRTMVQVEAPDRIGLLWAVADHLASRGSSIESARLGGDGGTAHDVFIVMGEVDAAALTQALSGAARVDDGARLSHLLTAPLVVGTEGLRLAARLLGRGQRGSAAG